MKSNSNQCVKTWKINKFEIENLAVLREKHSTNVKGL
jgi:hypothetical protein